MTFHSSNSASYETMPLSGIVEIVRNGMQQGCIHPCHLYDAVDELVDRCTKQQLILTRAHELVREIVNGEYYKSEDLRPIADALWDAIHKGDKEWKKIHLDGKGN